MLTKQEVNTASHSGISSRLQPPSFVMITEAVSLWSFPMSPTLLLLWKTWLKNSLSMLVLLFLLQKWYPWRKIAVHNERVFKFGIFYRKHFFLHFAFKCLLLSGAMGLGWGKVFRAFVCLFFRKGKMFLFSKHSLGSIICAARHVKRTGFPEQSAMVFFQCVMLDKSLYKTLISP